ncbi:transporter [Virgisporangium ochraceum]|uniref:Transporter n=2 Tax=Virgisporangium ochraceum TaxID=65505 RepID=A0A8J4EA97_9ACTN|nr:transporter [Virgisporangium ochraceum]
MDHRIMRTRTLLALTSSGLLWGTTVPLSKVALADWGPAWLTVARFTLAALPLAWIGRRHLRRALTPGVAGWGVAGYGVVIVLQNAGIERTSVSHAALLIGAMPVLVALLTVGLGRGRVGPVAWLGFAVALGGIAVISVDGVGAASLAGDALVLVSLLFAAAFMVAQPRLLAGRDPVAVTAVQLAAAALGTLPVAVAVDGVPTAAPGAAPMAAMVGLAVGGTLVPFTLFAWAQARISPEVAGAFLNLEPLVGVVLGVAAFGDPLGVPQVVGGAAILAGIGLNAVPLGGRRTGPAAAGPAVTNPAAGSTAGSTAGPRELTGAGVG